MKREHKAIYIQDDDIEESIKYDDIDTLHVATNIQIYRLYNNTICRVTSLSVTEIYDRKELTNASSKTSRQLFHCNTIVCLNFFYNRNIKLCYKVNRHSLATPTTTSTNSM
jgi:hypothetical protein